MRERGGEFSDQQGHDGLPRGCPQGVDVEGVVLAGVHGWGECVLDSVVPRSLVPIAGSSLIMHTLNWLRDGGVRKVKICANGDSQVLHDWLGTGSPLNLSLDYYEDRMPRGPAGCARDAVIDSSASIFVVVEGTVVPRVDVLDLLSAHRRSGAVLTVVVRQAGAAARNGQQKLEPAGIYVFSRTTLSFIPPRGYQDIKETLIPRLYAAGERVDTYRVNQTEVPRVTSVPGYLAVNQWAVHGLVRGQATLPGYVRLKEALIHESARLNATARFVGPVLIGPRCRIDEDALIIGPAAIGSDSFVGRQAVVSRSVAWSGCQIGAGAVLDQCVLTDGARIDDELIIRETVCLPPRASRAGWAERLRSVWATSRKSKGAGRLASAGRAQGPVAIRTREAARASNTDLKRPGSPPARSASLKERVDE